ncbi:MAG: N-acetylmuramoyl-L-alanine amidase [Methylovulum sp.]
MNRVSKILVMLSLYLYAISGWTAQVSIQDVRYLSEDKQFRLAFAVTALPQHKVFMLQNPARLVIDFKQATFNRHIKQPIAEHPLFLRLRSAVKDKTDLRVVVDLKKHVNLKKVVPTVRQVGSNQFIVELSNASFSAPLPPPAVAIVSEPLTVVAMPTPLSEPKQAAKVITASPQPLTTPVLHEVTAETKPNHPTSVTTETHAKPVMHLANGKAKSNKPWVIAIDAGHGGDDPGAQGQQGTSEKKITYDIAKKVVGLVNAKDGMKAFMVRKGDYYLGLRHRIEIARAAKADLFISIHADACDDPAVKGASVYVLSTRGASSDAARWLANSENAIEVGGVNLSDKEDILASVLLDLTQTATQRASLTIANRVLEKFNAIGVLHKDSVQRAGFIVLKAPDIPSILIETAYISNQSEEQNLNSQLYQHKIAEAILSGVVNYFKRMPPVDSKVATL